MFCYYKSFSWLFPQILLLARPGSEVIIVSPWIENVPLDLPVFRKRDGHFTPPIMPLADFMQFLTAEFGLRITVYVREPENFKAIADQSKKRIKGQHLKVIYTEYNHAKVFVTEDFCLTGSTNLIWTSIYRNSEVCTLDVNRYGDASQWIRRHLNI